MDVYVNSYELIQFPGTCATDTYDTRDALLFPNDTYLGRPPAECSAVRLQVPYQAGKHPTWPVKNDDFAKEPIVLGNVLGVKKRVLL